jgi:hypothetical protein
MNVIKLIAYHLDYEYVKLTSVTNPHTLKWYKLQGFSRESKKSDEHYYKIKSKDQYYNRARIEGTCNIIIPSQVSSKSSSKKSKKSSKKNTTMKKL